MARDRSHLTLIKTEQDIPPIEIFGKLFEVLADQHAALELSAWNLFTEIVDKGFDPADMKVDGALLQLDLAQIVDNVDHISGELPPVEYMDSKQRREKEKIRTFLLGESDYEE